MPETSHRMNLGRQTSEVRFFRATGAGVMAETITFARPGQFLGFRLALSAVGGTAAESFTLTGDDNVDEVYDTLLFSKDMETTKNIREIVSGDDRYEAGDKIIAAWANDATKTWALTLIYQMIE